MTIRLYSIFAISLSPGALDSFREHKYTGPDNDSKILE